MEGIIHYLVARRNYLIKAERRERTWVVGEQGRSIIHTETEERHGNTLKGTTQKQERVGEKEKLSREGTREWIT